MITFLKNMFLNNNRYKEHSEAVIISCFFNPQNSPYRTKAFKIFYESIKHLNHLIIECVIGDSEPELSENENFVRVKSDSLLWHKEALLNLAVKKLPKKYKYVFWADCDIILTNLNWMTDAVDEFKAGAKILQPFEFCVHLDKDEEKPSFDLEKEKYLSWTNKRHPKVWRSFCANYVDSSTDSESSNYDRHGHVGFFWGATRKVLESVPLYDRALIGGSDHLIAHSAASQYPNQCIDKSFTEDLDAVYEWSKKFDEVVDRKIAYVKGDLFHIWHGDIEKRQYLKRIQDFTPTTKQIVDKDENGLYVAKKGEDKYVKEYFKGREVPPTKVTNNHYHNKDDGFNQSLMYGYITDDPLLGTILGGNPAGAIVGSVLNNRNQNHASENHTQNSRGVNNENFS